MKAKFDVFLGRLETETNKPLIEAIREGFNAITEGYADVREERVSAMDNFNQMASMTASSLGNNVLNFLDSSSQKFAHLYTVDEEPELDYRATSEFNQYHAPIVIKDEIEEDLGLTADDLAMLDV